MTREELIVARQELGLRQSELTLLLGCRPGYVKKLEDAVWMRQGEIPPTVVNLIRAFQSGYRPSEWPERRHSPRKLG